MAQIEDLYHEVYPGIMARAHKMAKGNKCISEDWASEAVFTMVEVFNHYNDSMEYPDLVRFIGRAVARRISVCYQEEKRKSLKMISMVHENYPDENDFRYQEVESKLTAKQISEMIEDKRIKQFFLESYDPSSDTVEIVERRITIRKEKRENGKLTFGMDRGHPTDKEIGQKIGISKATASRFRSELKQRAEEEKWL